MNMKIFYNSIYKICQSSNAFLLDDLLDFEIVFTRAIRGSGRKKAIPKSNEEYCKKKKEIIEMKKKIIAVAIEQ